MFDISFEDPAKPGSKEKAYAYQNSWGITTRTIGVMIMIHGDDKGLVLPPRATQVQTIIVPCGATKTEEEAKAIRDRINEINDCLNNAGIKSKADLRDQYRPGWKFNHWEQKGVPIRIEIGPKDVQSGGCVLARRVDGEKITVNHVSMDNGAFQKLIKNQLNQIHDQMYAKAQADLDSHLRFADNWADFISALNDGCLVQVPFSGEIADEDEIKRRSAEDTGGEAKEAGAPSMGAKSLCIPFDPLRKLEPGMKCIISGKPATQITMFGRSY